MKRRGIASIVGTVFFALTFLAAIGSLAYLEGEQAQYNNAVQSSQNLQSLHQRESLAYQQLQNGTLFVQNPGASSSQIVGTILKFSNGSIYESAATASVGSRNLLPVASLIPSSYCGLSTCLSKYNTILGSTNTGDMIGLVTSLGNVFWFSHSSASSSSLPSQNLNVGNTWKSFTNIGANDAAAQIYQNPYDTTRFYVSVGSTVYAFSSSTGGVLWSFNAGQGQIVDVLPLSNGYVYIEDGYGASLMAPVSAATVVELSPSGTLLNTYTMRLMRQYTWIEIQYPDNDIPPYPYGSFPVQKGADSLYAAYDGWFLSSSGIATSPTYPPDSYNLATADSSKFYMFTPGANPGGWGCTNPRGNTASFYAYEADQGSVGSAIWNTYVYLNDCNLFPPYLISSTAGSGVVVMLVGQSYYSQPNYFGGPYQGLNPYLVVLSAASGSVLFSNYMDQPGYSSGMATDGTYVYLGLLGSNQIERVTISSGAKSFYSTQVPPTSVFSAYGRVFAVGSNGFQAFDSNMNSLKVVQFGTNSELYSYGNPLPFELGLHQPSLVVLNSTAYASVLRNPVTGLGTLQIGRYG